MTIYALIFSFCILGLFMNNLAKSETEKKIFVVTTLMTLCLVSGTRYYLGGTDYNIYIKIYNSLPTVSEFISNYNQLDNKYITYGVERGYLFLNSLVKTLGFNFFGFTLIHSIIFYICLYLGLKKYNYNLNLLIIVFLYKLFFYNTFISMRQSITLAIFFCAMHYIEDKNPIKYFICSFIALYLHNGSIILFLVYFINKFTLTKEIIIILNIIFIPTILISSSNLPVLRVFDFIVNLYSNPIAIDKANKLINGVPLSSIGIFHTLEYFLIMLVIIITFDKIITIDKHVEFILKLFLVLLPIFTLFRNYELLTRTKDYFTLTYAIILGYICLIDNEKYSGLVQLGTIIICAYGFFRFIRLFDGGAMMPYESFIFKGISILTQN